MKIGFVFVLYNTPESEKSRLKKEVEKIGFAEYKIYFVDNTKVNRGYAGGVNVGISQGLKDGIDLFVICNPDLSLSDLRGQTVAEAARHFDIWGLAMKQDGKIYYGGEVDNWRMSGGLIEKKPIKRFVQIDFPSGSLMFIKRKVIEKTGLWDESYFLYYDEVDYCWKARQDGFKIGIDCDSTYTHFEVSKQNLKKEFYLNRGRIKFLLKYGSLKQKLYELVRLPKTIYEEVAKRPFYFNFFSLNFSSLVNKALHFLLFLILIRTFIPSEYAIYTLAWTHIGLLLPLLDFGTTSYGLVNLPGKKQSDISALFSFRVFLSIVTFVLTIVLAFIFKYPPQVLIPIILTSIVVFANMFSGTYLISSSIIEKSYLVSYVSMIFQIFLILALIVGIYITKQMTPVFVIIFIMYALYGLVNFVLLRKQVKTLSFRFDPSVWLKIGRKSIVFLLISLLAGFYSKADILLLNFLKGERDVGLYSAGYRFLDALMFMITSYNVSAMPIFSKLAKGKKEAFITKIKKDFFLVIVIGLLTAGAIFIVAPLVLPFLMKGDYDSSIRVLQIVIFSLPLILLTSIALNCLYALGKAKTVIYLFLLQLTYNLILNFIFIPRYSYFASAWITLFGEMANAAVSFIILRKAINESFR